MSKTLNLVDTVLAHARNLHNLGVEDRARRALDRLAALRELEPEVAEEVQSRLAEILFQRGKFRRARRHLQAALAYQPDNPHYHHLMASAVEADVHCTPDRALEHWRRALELEPEEPQYLSAFGLLAVREGQTEEGLTALRRAHELAPDNLDVLASCAEGLCHAGLHEEARALLRAALFRNAREPRVRQLWNDFQFKQLRAEQESSRRQRLAATPEDVPTVLPFVRPAPGTLPSGSPARILRRDRATRRQPPHLPTRLPDQKHA
jgi:tetratricopeptide (TPR) repeat protein